MDVKQWMGPQDKQFFDALDSEAENVLAGAKALKSMIDDFHSPAEHRRRIKDIEHQGDEIVHLLYGYLNQAFVTPLAKEDLSGLASKLDDVLDYIHAAATRIAIYEIDQRTKPMGDFADLIQAAAEQLRAAVAKVRDRSSKDSVLAATIEVNRLENLADEVLINALAELLKGTDPIRIIKLKEIYETLEIVTDRCEDVANILEDIVLKGR